MGEQETERHPTEGLPDYERQRHDAIQEEHNRYNAAVDTLNKEHRANLEKIESDFQAAHAAASGEQPAKDDIPY